ncbi:MAG: aspartate-semialdehyde dehydrogenase [Bacteroidetes bacterium HGW-Bacteroidetes-1]|jgi:aspartate-semialdehyde dehydrogenase|nr:MAG: aspartate-semialdehyde dehydrogenase [Bacteroidetes bacterium HGW-Bacteroidetes-1]
MKIAVIGATGLVGQMMLQVLEEQQIDVDQLIPVASAKSLGKTILFKGKEINVVSAEDAIAQKPSLALFSAGGAASLTLAPRFAEAGITVIDNSSAWRKDVSVPLVVPEVNAKAIKKTNRIIANPNCSTIQLVAAIAPLHHKFVIRRLVISTYQSVTGSGIKGQHQLENEQKGLSVVNSAYPHPIHMNVIPHGGDFDESGSTSEEQKLVFETRKIMDAPDIAISATVVRVPVTGGHSMSVNIEFEKKFDLQEVRQLLESSPGLKVQDNPAENYYPMPLYAQNKDEVFVGRIRRDESISNGLNMWIVADNLRKGAATNAVQIAAWLIQNNYIH